MDVDPIQRFSSRTQRLDKSFLLQHLQQARCYKRIAGYFTSSLFEVADELLEAIPEVKIVCNADIHPDDLKIAQLRESKLIGRWNENAVATEALLQRDRYRRLDQFFARHGQAVRVAANSICGFLHGKAGVIERFDGRKIGFIGSMNETRSGWQHHYEILWEDQSAAGIAWIEAEFQYLWEAACPLPKAVIQEVRRCCDRREVDVARIEDDVDLAPAALIESPLYRQGMSLQPWQQGFISECFRHYHNHGRVRLLLADEVGLGKTLALATAALALCLLGDKQQQRRRPVVIFAPATLCEQWQTELIDKLEIPCARWHSQKKAWLDVKERIISAPGEQQVAQCPLRIGIVSTGLVIRDSIEKQYLLGLSYSLIIVDEAHKARRRQGVGRQEAGTANRLLSFLRRIAAQSEHVLLATATPIQTGAEDLWDLIGILDQGKGRFVLGGNYSLWRNSSRTFPILTGEQPLDDPSVAWDLLRSPLPLVNSTQEPKARHLYSAIRQDLRLGDEHWQTNQPLTDLGDDTREVLEAVLAEKVSGAAFFQRENPFVRHIVLRRRTILEDAGLLTAIAVEVHPDSRLATDIDRFHRLFEGKALRTDADFREAYAEAQHFGQALARRGKGSGFMKNLMEQRICSSIVAGINTARKLLEGQTIREEADDGEIELTVGSEEETVALQRLIARLEQITVDPKLAAVIHYLEHENWQQYGVILFSQYYDTAQWIAASLARRYPKQSIGLYAGIGRSRLYRDNDSVQIDRETLKSMIAEHELCLMAATDAAGEGLNLQTLGALINVDLPWNPTKLEQRLGRIKRFGQALKKVNMLNLVNEGSVEEIIYDRLSERMRDRYNIFGSLPDTIRDEWIVDIETIGEKMDEYIDAQKQATGFDLRYTATMTAAAKDWRECSEVLSRHDFAQLMSASWES